MKKSTRKKDVILMKFAPGMRWFCIYSYFLLPVGILLNVCGIINFITTIFNIEDKTNLNLPFVFLNLIYLFAVVYIKFHEYYLIRRLNYTGYQFVIADAIFTVVGSTIATIVVTVVNYDFDYDAGQAVTQIFTVFFVLTAIEIPNCLYFYQRKHFFRPRLANNEAENQISISEPKPEAEPEQKQGGGFVISKFAEKYEKLVSAAERLKQAVADYDNVRLDSVRDGAIQRFEFCTELAWKTVREYLIEQGYTDINSPKSVMKTAFSDGIISDGDGWLEILESRNITSHVYDEKTAETVFKSIKNSYITLFEKLIKRLGE